MDWRLAGYVSVGSAVGGFGRYAVTGWATRGEFPTGTLVVNLIGSFLIGLLLFGGVAGGWGTPVSRAFLAMGILGGFTTMSSFSYETISFLEGGAWRPAAVNVVVSILGCLAATGLGRAAGLWIWTRGA